MRFDLTFIVCILFPPNGCLTSVFQSLSGEKRQIETNVYARHVEDPELVADGVNLSALSLSTLRHVD